ncbi:hypothetical protein JL720_5995 [Aureococcus anophagefferens]|nr:hypothetical protein JL720_5995 [Aureococcus anophagefferens]
MIARPKISRNERKTTEIGAFEVWECRTLFLPRSLAAPAAEPRGRDDDVAPFEDILVTTLKAAAARATGCQRRARRRGAVAADALHALACAELSRVEGPRRLLAAAAEGLRAAGGRAIDEDGAADGDGPARRALDPPRRGADGGGARQRLAGARKARRGPARRRRRRRRRERGARGLGGPGRDRGAQRARSRARRAADLDAVAAAAVLRGRRRASSVVLQCLASETASAGPVTMGATPRAVAGFVADAVAAALDRGAWAPLTLDPKTVLDGVAALAAAANARSSPSDAGAASLGAKCLSAAAPRRQRRAKSEDAAGRFRDLAEACGGELRAAALGLVDKAAGGARSLFLGDAAWRLACRVPGAGDADGPVAGLLAAAALRAWAQSPRAEHKANLALFFDGDAAGGDALGDAPGGDVEALVSWALDDDAGAAAEKAPKRKKAPPQLDAASEPGDDPRRNRASPSTRRAVALVQAVGVRGPGLSRVRDALRRALAKAPKPSLDKLLGAGFELDTEPLCEVLACAVADDGAAARAADFVAGNGPWDDRPAANRPLEQLLVLAAALSNGLPGLVDALAKAASSEVQKRGADGPSLGVARTLELAAALVAGLCGAADALEPPRAVLPEPPPPVKAVEAPEPDALRCTYATSGGDFVDQHWYNCATCGLVGDKGCCSACARKCHAGHELSYSRKSSFFCDCGARGDGDDDGAPAWRTRWAAGATLDEPAPSHASGAARRRGGPAARAAAAARRRRRAADDAAAPAALPQRRFAAVGGFDARGPGDVGSGPVARQLKALVSRHRLAPRLISADRRGRVAVAERRHVLLTALTNCLAPNGGDGGDAVRAAACALGRLSVAFDVAGVAFCPSSDRHLAVWGLRDCSVFALDGGARRGDAASATGEESKTDDAAARLCASAQIRVELALDALASDSAHVVKCAWVPRSSSCLVVATTLGVHVYDLAVDASTPTHAYVLAYDQHHVRDAVVTPPRHAWAARSTVQAHALVLSRDGAPAVCVCVTLGEGVRDVVGGFKLLNRALPGAARPPAAAETPARRELADELLLAARGDAATGARRGGAAAPAAAAADATHAPYAAWVEWPRSGGGDGHLDVVCVAAAALAPRRRQARVRAPPPRALGRRRYRVLRPPDGDRDDDLDGDESDETPSRWAAEAPRCTVFEELVAVPHARLDFSGDLCLGNSRDELRRKLRPGNDEYLVASRAEGGTFVARSERPGDVEVVRVLLGAASPEHVPRTLVVCGRRLDVSRDDRRWRGGAEAASRAGAAEDAAAHHPLCARGPALQRCLVAAARAAAIAAAAVAGDVDAADVFPRDGRDPFGGVVSLATKASKPNPLCRAALRLVEKTCLGESQRALAFAAATLVRVGCDFDGDAAAPRSTARGWIASTARSSRATSRGGRLWASRASR